MEKSNTLAIPPKGSRRNSGSGSNIAGSFEGGAGAPTPIKAILHDNPKATKKKANAAASSSGKQPATTKTPLSKPVTLFTHLSQFSRSNERLPPANVHPAVVKFALQCADFEILGGTRRCRAMLHAFRAAIQDYRANPDMAICRHLDQYLKPMIGYVVDARPMAVAMANAVRLLRYHISILPPEISEQQAITSLIETIDAMIMSRLDTAQTIICEAALEKIVNGDVVLTFAHSKLVEHILIEAHKRGTTFRVILVDSRPFGEGKSLLRKLVTQGVPCTFIAINALGYVIRQVTKTLVGAAGIYANGTVLSRVGTAAICSLSRHHSIPVMVCCESIKFSERSQIDSFVFNEIGDPDALLLSQSPTHQGHRNGNDLLSGWREMPALKLLNILYDVTPAECVSVVVSEHGMLPVTSIPVVLREHASAQQSFI